MRLAIYRQRQKLLPAKLPKSCSEAYDQLFVLQPKIRYRNEQFLHVNEQKTMIMLTGAENLSLLQDCDYVFGDGTFAHSPQFFKQLYTIHVLKNSYYVPFAYLFLTGKSASTYELMWRELKSLSVKLTRRLRRTGQRIKQHPIPKLGSRTLKPWGTCTRRRK